MNNQRIDSTIDSIIEAIKRNEEFLVLTHLNPDGDGVGSLVALGRVLTALGKSCDLLSPGEIPPEYLFLANIGEIAPSIPSQERWDVVFLLDIPCLSRLPSALSGEVPACDILVNIDHHRGNSICGTLNWIDAEASSVGEMLYWLFEKAGYPLSSDVAAALYAAILTDTGSFRFPNVTPSALTAAARLLERGADAAAIADRVYASRSLRKYRLLEEALATLQTCCSNRAAFMWVTQDMLNKVGGSMGDTADFENFPRTLGGVEIAILFKQKTDCQTVHVSLRSRRCLHDVSRVAESFGGGGHPGAAGCVVTGSMLTVQEQVLTAVARQLARADSAAPDSAQAETENEE
jgi:phosphoesterase RecJ-like protein